MYYIVNQTNQIIAADKTLMDVLGVDNLGELHKNIALNSIEFTTLTDNKLDITTAQGASSYTISKNTMTSWLGDLILVEIVEENIEKSIIYDSLDIEPITFDDGMDKLIDEIHEENEEDKPFELISDDNPITFGDSEESKETISILDDEPFDILGEKTTDDSKKEIEDTTPIVIDISDVSNNIGISSDDYTSFLNEYIDTALTLEDDLKSENTEKISHAISTLSHLSNVLHLPILNDIIGNIEHSDNVTQSDKIENFYKTLARLTTETEQSIDTTVSFEDEDTLEIEPSISELLMERSDDISSNADSFGTIDLSNVSPIHFDFQLEEAATDLSLPVELIEEFVVDFIEQAHTETDKMLEAYERGDIDAIQKIGHLLKGTSSNLRINPLADTLYNIQFCEDSSKLEDLIKEYWAHFLSFETKINLISK